jgi:hypothetical protein
MIGGVMRIILISGGLYLLAAMPVAAQETSDSTRVFAVSATTPVAPNLQEMFVGAGAALMGLCFGLVLRSGGKKTAGVLRSP